MKGDECVDHEYDLHRRFFVGQPSLGGQDLFGLVAGYLRVVTGQQREPVERFR